MKAKHQPWLLLAAGTLFMFFFNGRWVLPLAAWIFPIFFLRFMRSQKAGRGFLYLALVSAIVNIICWWRMIPAPRVAYFLITGLAFQVFMLPFLFDRILYPRIKGFSSTLIFPLSFCSIEFLATFLPDKGTWGALGYTQSNNLTLLQLASITGLWGISFLVTWFSSVITWAWLQSFEWTKIRRGTVVFAGLFAAVLLFGFIRLSSQTTGNKTVRTASIVTDRAINKELKTCHWDDAKGISQYSNDLEDNLIDCSKRAALSGAKIVLWQESAGFIPMQEEKNFIAKGIGLAKEERIYLLMTLWSIPEDYPKHLVENKIIGIDPAGNIKFNYVKNRPAVVEPIVRGSGGIPVLETPYGKIAPAICHDGDFQSFIRQAGENNADILFMPANDWKEIDPIHSYMGIMRAIENGFSLVHPAGQGLSVATDNRGRVIASMDFYSSDQQIMLADVPIRRTNTIYAQTGDIFAWLCIAGFISMIMWVLLARHIAHIDTSPDGRELAQNIKPGLNRG